MRVLKWAYIHGALQVDEYDNIQEAAEAAGMASDYGDEALDCIEITDDQGNTQQTLGWNELEPYLAPVRARQEVAYRERPLIVAVVDLLAPNGRTAPLRNITEGVDAESILRETQDTYGKRASIRWLKVASR